MNLESSELGPGKLLIALSGRLDIAGAAEIETAFSALASHAQVTLVDLSQVPFVASIGIRLLLANAKALYKRGGKMVLFAAVPDVERVLLITGVGELAEIVSSRDDALRFIETPAG